MKFFSTLSLSTFALLASSPALRAQNAPAPLNFPQLATTAQAPARLQLKNLSKSWQRMTIEDGEQNPYAAMYGFGARGQMFDEMLANEGFGVYYSKGQSVSLGSETFLVAYRIERNLSAQDIQALFQNFGGHGRDNEAPQQGPRKFGPNTPLVLSLLNLRTIGNLKDVRAFNPSNDILGPRDVIEASDDNLRALGRFLVQFSDRRRYGNQRLPLRDAANLRQTFINYFHARPAIFTHPSTGEAYRTNAALAGKQLPRIATNLARVVAIYEAQPGTDGKFGTVFLDGHVERVPENRWKAVRAVMPQKPGPVEVRRLSDLNLRKLRFDLVRYARRSGGVLPRMNSVSSVRSDLGNYIGVWNATYFNHPETNQGYRPNALLSRLKLSDIKNTKQLAAFYEATPGSDGKLSVIFLDGHIERISPSNWNRVKATKVQLKQAASKQGTRRAYSNNLSLTVNVPL